MTNIPLQINDGSANSVDREKINSKDIQTLDPIVSFAKSPKINERIFEQLDSRSLTICRKVAKSWLKCIDEKMFFWNQIVTMPKVQKGRFHKFPSSGIKRQD